MFYWFANQRGRGQCSEFDSVVSLSRLSLSRYFFVLTSGVG